MLQFIPIDTSIFVFPVRALLASQLFPFLIDILLAICGGPGLSDVVFGSGFQSALAQSVLGAEPKSRSLAPLDGLFVVQIC
jgi:hypothetical protein